MFCVCYLLQLGEGFKKFNFESRGEYSADTEENQRLAKGAYQTYSNTQVQNWVMEVMNLMIQSSQALSDTAVLWDLSEWWIHMHWCQSVDC